MDVPLPESAHAFAELWHIAVACFTLIGFFIGWDRHFNAPERRRRADIEKRLSKAEWRLEQGDKEFKRLDGLEASMAQHEAKQQERHEKVLERLTAIETILRERGGIPNQ